MTTQYPALEPTYRCLGQVNGFCPGCQFDPEHNPDCPGWRPIGLYVFNVEPEPERHRLLNFDLEVA